MAFDAHTQFHETWLGMVQPVEGLVVSIPVLVEAQTMERHGPELQARLQSVCPLVNAETGLEIDDVSKGRTKKQRAELVTDKLAASRRYRDLAELLEQLLGWTPDLYDRGDALPENLKRYIAEGHQTIRPTLALRKLDAPGPADARAQTAAKAIAADDADPDDDDHDDDGDDGDADGGDGDGAAKPSGRSLTAMPDIETPESLAGKPYVALVWELPTGLDLDKPETQTGDWRYPPSAKFDRLLRAVRVPIGLLTNGEVIRLVYAPHGEASGSITFDLTDMSDIGGRPILDAFVMLLSAQRFFGVRPEDALPALLRRSRERQANVTNTLAAQVFDALDLLLRGFEQAAGRDRHADVSALLRRDDPDDPEGAQDDHLYGGLLTVLLRLVFILYAEDRELLPTSNELYARSLSFGQLFEDLQRDHDAFPDTMGHRFGAWSRLLSLFRTIHDGVEHGSLRIPRRRGELFDPSRFPFLESWGPPNSPVERDLSGVGVPTVDDETVFRVLERLMYLEGQRLSYKVLSVEQIGSVYEALMGYGVERLGAAAVCCGHKSLQKGSTGGVWVEAGPVLATSASGRSKFLVATYNIEKGAANRIADDLKKAKTEADVLGALDRIALKRVPRRRVGQLVLQPGEERRRTSSHYTPRSLSEPIVRKTLEPLLRAMSPSGDPSSKQLLSLKICDPAMGSGAFLVEACRFLGDHVVAAWEREGQMDKIASAKEDVVNHARRLVAQTCLYGVDKNPFAVSLAKLSLWLETLAKDEPFTFVDHALKHGDSLVGLSFEQIKAFHWTPSTQMELIEQELSSVVAESLKLRQEIIEMAGDSSPGTTRLKEQLLWDANDAQDRLRIVSDLVIGAFFEEGKAAERESERKRRLEHVRTWLGQGGELPSELRHARERLRRQVPAFHWPLEFPEIFHGDRKDPLAVDGAGEQARMDALVGNPPFAGKNGIARTGGPAYLDWLKALHERSHGNADLCAHFFRRADALLGAHGTIGLIATNTIAQGDTRRSGLHWLVETGDRIYDATRSMLWPGEAAVAVSIVHLAKGKLSTLLPTSRLDGEEVESINSRLRGKRERPEPVVLSENENLSFQGTIVLGMGFTLTRTERDELVRQNRQNSDRILPYIGGKEVNTSPTQDFDRYVISFGQMELEEAKRWPDLLEIVRERVKPERDKLKNNPDGRRRKQFWWQFGRWTPALYAAIEPKQRCLVTSIHTKHFCVSFQPTARIFSHAMIVFAFEQYAAFGVLQSRVHEPWAWLLSSSMKSDLRYSATDCFETFPLPHQRKLTSSSTLESISRELYEARAKQMVARNQGLTTTYNQLKDHEVTDAEIVALRKLHIELDRAVLAAYGWEDIAVPPYTKPMTDAEWKARDTFEDEVIDRLFALNAQRAAEEKALGAASASTTKAQSAKGKSAKAPRSKKRAPIAQLALGDEVTDE